ncbi:MAG TPA: NUDIX domain-containing protein [Brumimicrobium sp.]|nr:NUDIX domain-containing protein [Brumimicrobium sp.]
MYKVFINNVPIYFGNAALFKSNIPSDFLPRLSLNNFNSFITAINELSIKEDIFIDSTDPMAEIHRFFDHFEWIETAGGIVQNSLNLKCLYILRNGFWDIPKGVIETEENPKTAAMREIKEECGIKNLEINGKLSPTYHVYYGYGKHFIKKTHWFTFTTKEKDVQPQLEEGITETRWLSQNELNIVKNNTFSSILDVINNFETVSK